MQINELLLYFLATVVFSFLIGLEVRAYLSKFHENDSKIFLGTIRTYTFLGIIGFILYAVADVDQKARVKQRIIQTMFGIVGIILAISIVNLIIDLF